jgi:hypothetical protein
VDKKAIWGPPTFLGRSAFPVYRDLGVRYWQTGISWAEVAPVRPAIASDPRDPAYRWPPALDAAVREARRYHIEVALMVVYTPPWANGGLEPRFAPSNPRDYADFVTAVARHFPSIHLWMIWGEPTRLLLPMPPGRPTGPRVYARLVDAAYGALKRVDRRNQVIGGMSYTVGVVSPPQWARWMRLPNGRPPRLDMWGHNPYDREYPHLTTGTPPDGSRPLSALPALMHEIDAAYPGRHLPLWLSEYSIQSDHDSGAFDFHVSRGAQARYVTAAYNVACAVPRVAALGWYRLEDEAPNGRGTESNVGLLTFDGHRKPSYATYRRLGVCRKQAPR